jgi:hypothetical protein
MEDLPLNTSDHQPVWLEAQIELTVKPPAVRQCTSENYVPNWKKISYENLRLCYAECVCRNLSKLPLVWVFENMEKFTNQFVSSLLAAAKESVPRRVFCKYTKPTWYSTLPTLSVNRAVDAWPQLVDLLARITI